MPIPKPKLKPKSKTPKLENPTRTPSLGKGESISITNSISPCSQLLKTIRRGIGIIKLNQRTRASSSFSMEVNNNTTQVVNNDDTLVQYVVLRRDLIDTWPLGSVVTQGCHASVAAIVPNKDDPDTADYCSPQNIDAMHKVTLEVKGETQLVNLSEKLKVAEIAYKLWIEQPENIPTCLATKPYRKSVVSSYFKKLKLCK